MATEGFDISLDDILAAASAQTASLEADAELAPAGLVQSALGADLTDGLASLAARKASAAMFQRDADAAAGKSTAISELVIRQELALVKMAGGDPDAVRPDHVTAWVNPPAGSGLTYGFNAVPVSLAVFNDETSRWECDFADVAETLGYS